MKEFTTFPLCKAAGLDMFSYVSGGIPCIWASSVESMLESAPVIGLFDGGHEWCQPGSIDHATHTARLVCIEPLKPADTAESLLRELVDKINHMNGDACPWADALKRAQALLGGEK